MENKWVRFFRWLGTPFRAIARAMMTLICLTPRQIQSMCTVFLIGAIIIFSWQQWFYVMLARSMARASVPNESPAWDILTETSGDLFWLIGGCIIAICLIAWGATYFTAKIRQVEITAGQKTSEEGEL